MAGLIGTPRSFHDKFKFLVEFSGLGYAGFKSCSELAKEVADVDHWEGGRLIAHKSPGRVTIPDLTLEQGATDDLELYDWFEEVALVAANGGLVDAKYKRTGELLQLDRDNSVRQRYRISAAYPKRFAAGDWDNDADEKVIRTLVLRFDDWRPMIRSRSRR